MDGGRSIGCRLLEPLCHQDQPRVTGPVRGCFLAAAGSPGGTVFARNHDAGDPQQLIQQPIGTVLLLEQCLHQIQIQREHSQGFIAYCLQDQACRGDVFPRARAFIAGAGGHGGTRLRGRTQFPLTS